MFSTRFGPKSVLKKSKILGPWIVFQAHPQVLSLLDVIQFDSKFDIAFQSIFGAVALVKQPDVRIEFMF